MRHLLLPATALLLALAAGCSDEGSSPTNPGGGDSPPATVSYATDIQPIWDRACTGCHGQNGNGGLDLRAPGSRDRLVDVTAQNYSPAIRVVPGDPDNSVLYDKLTGGGRFGGAMPPGGLLPAADRELVRRWIADGAPDD